MGESQSLNTGERLAFAEPIRTVAIGLVIVVHVVAPLANLLAPLTPSQWWVANVFASLARPSVPLFVMLSGLLLLDPGKAEPLSVFFRKRFLRVLLPFLIWSVIYWVWGAYLRHTPLSPLAGLHALLQGTVYYHLWYIYVILGLYLLTPILRNYLAAASRTNQVYFLLLWFAVASILPATQKFTGLTVTVPLPLTLAYVGYFMLGWYLRPIQLSGRQRWLTLGLVVSLIAFTALGTYRLLKDNKVDPFFYDYLSPNIILISAGVFLILKSLPYSVWFDQHSGAAWIIGRVSEASFGIYLSHLIILEAFQSRTFKQLTGFTLDGQFIHPLIGIPLTASVVLMLSFSVVNLLRRIPRIGPFIS